MRLRERREALGLDRSEVARRAGISKEYVRLLELDQANPTLPIARRLAEALESTVDDLFPAREAAALG